MRAAPILAATLLLQGCAGALGGTNPFVLDVEPPAGRAPVHAVTVATVASAGDVNEIDSVGTYHVGELGDKELADVRKSLVDTLRGIAWPPVTTSSPALDVHLLYTHYYSAHSNNDGGILAGVDWALASGEEVVFSERFFASIQASDLQSGSTLGKAKDALNAQIVRRVVEKSLALAADPAAEPQAAVAHTYGTIEEAAAGMPAPLTSFMGLPSFSTKGVDWTASAPAETFDWPGFLAGPQ